MTHKLDNNKYLKDKIIKLENWEDVNFITNDMGGVDVCVDFDLEKLGVEITEKDFEEYIVDYCLHYDKERGLYQCTGEEAWYNTHSEEFIVPDLPTSRPNKNTSHRFAYNVQSDFHLWLLFENYVNESGYYPSLFDVNYHGYVDPHKFEENYREKIEPEKEQKLIENLLEIFEVNEYLEDHTQYLDDLPKFLHESVPQSLYQLEDVEIVGIEEINPNYLILKCSVGEGNNVEDTLKNLGAESLKINQYNETEFSVRVNLKHNSTRYILEGEKEDENSMSFLSVG